MHRHTITDYEAGQRLDKFLRKLLPMAGDGFIYKMLRKKNITLNGKRVTGREIIRTDDEVVFFIAISTLDSFQKSVSTTSYVEAYEKLESPRLLYEDKDILIVDKPSGVLSQKAKADDISLGEWLIGYLLNSGGIDETSLSTFRPAVLHRLDRNTGGVVICGKTLFGSQEVSRLLRERLLRRFYLLIVNGALSEPGELRGYWEKDSKRNKSAIKLLTKDDSQAKADGGGNDEANLVLTRYRPLKVSKGAGRGRQLTLVEAELVSGKCHQIRAQFAAFGYPLIGDYKYGDFAINDIYKHTFGIESQLMYAARVAFPPPAACQLEDLAGKEIKAEWQPQFELFFREIS